MHETPRNIRSNGGVISCALVLLGQSAAYASVQTCTWTGGAGSNKNWSAAQNWNCTDGTVPGNGAALVFPDGPIVTREQNRSEDRNDTNNDLPSANIYTSIKFEMKSYAVNSSYTSWDGYRVLGNTIKVAGDITTSGGGDFSETEVKAPVELAAPATLSKMKFGNLSTGSHDIIANNIGINKLAGSGDILARNNMRLDGDNSTSYIGEITMENGQLYIYNEKALGSTDKGTILKDGATLTSYVNEYRPSTMTIPEPFTFIGNGDDGVPKIFFILGKGFVGPDDRDDYVTTLIEKAEAVFTGGIRIQDADVMIMTEAGKIKFTGGINASGHGVKLIRTTEGELIIDSSDNNSTTPNGTYRNDRIDVILSDSQNRSLLVAGLYSVCVTGERLGDRSIVDDGGVLCGTGTVGNVEVARDGRIVPGVNGAGVLSMGNLDMKGVHTSEDERRAMNTFIDIELGGREQGQYDQLNVTGTVNLADATLNTSLINDFTPAVGDTFTIIKNDGNDAIQGTFKDLPQGATVRVGEYEFTISYTGGDGNDVVLTTKTVPGAPNTAGFLAKPANMMLAAGTALAGIVLFAIRGRMLKARK